MKIKDPNLRILWEEWKQKHGTLKSMGYSWNSAQRETYCYDFIYVSQINNLNFYLKKLNKEEYIKPKTSINKKIIKMRAEINKTGSRKLTEKNSKTQS